MATKSKAQNSRKKGVKETTIEEIYVEYDSNGVIISGLEVVYAKDLGKETFILEPQKNNKVKKFRFKNDVSKLLTDYKVDVSKKSHELVKK